MSMGANGNPLSQRDRNKIFKINPDDREALSPKTQLKCPGVTQHPRNQAVGAPANRAVESRDQATKNPNSGG